MGKREAGSAPTDITDREKIYEGYEPNFCDHTGVGGTTYYYLITTVDYSGNRSVGVSVSKTL